MRQRILLVLATTLLLCCGCGKTRQFPNDISNAIRIAESRPDSALVLLNANPRSESDGDFEYASWCLAQSFAQFNSFGSDLSYDQMRTGADYFIKHGTPYQKALAYYVRGAVSVDQKVGTESEWVDDMHHAVSEADKCDDHFIKATTNLRYATMLLDRKRYEAAIPFFEKGIEEAHEDRRYSFEVTGWINLSHVYLYLGDTSGDYSKAIEIGQNAVEVAKMINNDNDYCRALNSLSSCYSRGERFEEALAIARESVRMQEKLHDAGITKTPVKYLAIADAYRKVENADSAIFYARKGLSEPNNSGEIGYTQLLYIVYKDLLHNSDSTLKYLTRYNELTSQRDKMQENDKVILDEKKMQQDQSDMKAEESRKSIIGTALAAIAFLVLVLANIIILYKRSVAKRDRKIREQEIQAEITEVHLKESEQNRSELRSVLMDKDKFVESLREKPRYLQDSDWAKLENIVDKVCNSFCSRLKIQYPDMTQAEQRVAVLLRFHFSGQQMAAMLGISPTSVTKGKQRLKGRVSLPEGTTIEDFIAEF